MATENEDVLAIDKDRLDREWCEQPKLYLQWAMRKAKAEDALVRAKANMELVEAEVATLARQDPASYGLDPKPTVAALEAHVMVNADFRTVQETYFTAKHRVDVADAMVKALDHRKKGLESLVYLTQMGYNSEPKVRGEAAKEKTEEVVKQAVRGKGVKPKK